MGVGRLLLRRFEGGDDGDEFNDWWVVFCCLFFLAYIIMVFIHIYIGSIYSVFLIDE